MAGRKLFTNQTPHLIMVTLAIRSGDQPGGGSAARHFELPPGDQWVDYGSPDEHFLDALMLAANTGGRVVTLQEIVRTRGDAADTLLNTRNAIDIALSNDAFQVTSSEANQ